MYKKYCKHIGCPNIVERGVRFCPEHQQQQPVKVADGFYVSVRWRKFRNWYIARNPLCALCGDPGRMVDHIVELKDGGAELDESNCQTLCTRCHQLKTAGEKKTRKSRTYTY